MWYLAKPLDYVLVTSGWGADRSYRGGVHEGIDIRAPIGKPVRAAGGGTVIVADTSANSHAGRWIQVAHANGLSSRYMHLSGVFVRVGQVVTLGQVIGASGNTADPVISSAPHLHFDLRLKKTYLNAWIARFGKPTTGFPPHGEDVAVPSEPLIPADKYEDDVLRDAKRRGVPLYTGIGAGGIVLIGLAAYAYWKF